MNRSKNFIKKYIIFACLFVFTGLQALLYRPVPKQVMTPERYAKIKPQAHKVFEQIREEEEPKKFAKAVTLEIETQQLKTQRSKQCYDLTMLLDNDKIEKYDGEQQAIGYDFLSSLAQKNFPIIVSRNIVYNICSLIMHSGKIYSHEKGTPSSFIESITSSAVTAFKQLMVHSTIEQINLTNNDWICYDHPKADIMLFVPKSYISHFAQSSDNNTTEKMKSCGFDTTQLNELYVFSPHSLVVHIEDRNHEPIEQKTPLVQAIKSMFRIPDKPNLPTWNIYLSGHGETLKMIAGLPSKDFLELLDVFQKINCSCLYYISCFTGGMNQIYVQATLNKLNVNFIVLTNGINENTAAGTLLSFTPELYAFTKFFKKAELFFGNFIEFTQEKKLESLPKKDPIAFIADSIIHKAALEHFQPFVYIPDVGVFNAIAVDKSIKVITKSLAKSYEFENKPMDFTDSKITHVIFYPNYIDVPIHINPHAKIVFPTKQIAVPFPKKGDTKNKVGITINTLQKHIKTFTLHKTGPSYPSNAIMDADLHIFKKIICRDKLSSVIPHFAQLNSKVLQTMLIIKDLQCFDYQHSRLGNDYNTLITINNMFIFTQQGFMHDINGTFSASPHHFIFAIFEFNGKTYVLEKSYTVKHDIEETLTDLLKLFEKLPAQEIPNEIQYDEKISDAIDPEIVISEETKTANLGYFVRLLESTIDPTTRVQENQTPLPDVLKHKIIEQKKRIAESKDQRSWFRRIYDYLDSIRATLNR